MSTTRSKIYDELEEILEKNRDAVKGFGKAAENAQSPKLKAYFQKKATTRSNFNTELLSEIKLAYTDYDNDGSFSGTIHRAWMDIKSLFSADNDESMLEESIRGDKAAIKEYDDVLGDTTIPAKLRSLLTTQRNHIESVMTKNQVLEDIA